MKLLTYGSLLAVVAGTSLAAVKTDYDHSISFSQYRTFAWKPAQAGSRRSDDNSFLRSRITAAIDERLAGKGMHEDRGNPDVYLTYRFTAQPRREVDYLPGWGWRHGGLGGPNLFVSRYTQGTLVIDMVDARTGELVWRAYGDNTASNPLDVQSQKKIDKIVSQAMKNFPPKNNRVG